jgi:DNA end-binding protein Ku
LFFGENFAGSKGMAKKKAHHKKILSKREPKKGKTKKKEHSSASQRGLWSGAISFGLVNIPVRLVSAREQKELRFIMLDPSNLSPVGYKYYNKSTGEEISRSKTVKAFEHKPHEYVIFTDADFKKANPEATQTVDIENFVSLDEIDPVYFEKAYYLLPNKGGQKAYQLLTDALRKSRKVAIAKIVLHTKQHLVALIPRGKFLLLEMLHFASDVKELNELGDMDEKVPATKAASPEMKMAEQLIDEMTTKWRPQQYHDTYRDDIMKRVEAKVKAGKATEITKDFEPKKGEEETAEVLDLMPLLRKSLAAGKSSSSTTHAKSAHRRKA